MTRHPACTPETCVPCRRHRKVCSGCDHISHTAKGEDWCYSCERSAPRKCWAHR